MTNVNLNKALQELEKVKSLQLDKSNYILKGNSVKYFYKPKTIYLENYTLLVIGYIEQTHTINQDSEKIVLSIALKDKKGIDHVIDNKQQNLIIEKLIKN